MNQTIELMQSLGFTNYEARAYVALLKNQSVTAYELAKSAGIPTSKIYEVVARLIDRRITRPTDNQKDNKQRYVALPAADMLHRIREETKQATRELAPLLEDVTAAKEANLIWPIEANKVQQLALSMIETAQKTVLISLWPEELEWLLDALARKRRDGLSIALVHFGTDLQLPAPLNPAALGATYLHPAQDTLYEEKGGRGLTLVTDSDQVLIANYLADGSFDASWSRNQAFVTVAEDYVKHDVYITKVTRFLDREVRLRFGEHYEKLRDVFSADA